MTQREQILSYIKESLKATELPQKAMRSDRLCFADPQSGKRFAVIQAVPRAKCGLRGKGTEEILTIRCDPLLSGSLRLQQGFLPAIGIPGDDWISILLNNTVPTDSILPLLMMAITSVGGDSPKAARDWLIPANPKYFDLFAAFRENDIILWKQSSRISVGDTVYLYVAAPYSAILFQCRAVEVDIPYTKKNSRRHITKAMRIQLLHTYESDSFPLSVLKDYGVTTVRGPRSVPPALRKALENVANQ